MTGIFCHLPGLTSSSSERGSSAQELRLQRIPHRNIKIGWFPLHKVRVKDVTTPVIVDTAVLLPGSSGVVHQKSLPDDVPEGVMALDAERAKTTTQSMVPLWVDYLPAGAAEGLGGEGKSLMPSHNLIATQNSCWGMARPRRGFGSARNQAPA